MMFRSAVSAIALVTVLSAPAHADNLVLNKQGGTNTSAFIDQTGSTGFSNIDSQQFAKATARIEFTQEDGTSNATTKQFADTAIGIGKTQGGNAIVDNYQSGRTISAADFEVVGVNATLNSKQESNLDSQLKGVVRGGESTAVYNVQLSKRDSIASVNQTSKWNYVENEQRGDGNAALLITQVGTTGNIGKSYQTGYNVTVQGTTGSDHNAFDNVQWATGDAVFLVKQAP